MKNRVQQKLPGFASPRAGVRDDSGRDPSNQSEPPLRLTAALLVAQSIESRALSYGCVDWFMYRVDTFPYREPVADAVSSSAAHST